MVSVFLSYIFLCDRKHICQEERKPDRAKAVPQSPVISASPFFFNMNTLFKPHLDIFFFWSSLFITLPPPSPFCSHFYTHAHQILLFYSGKKRTTQQVNMSCKSFVLLCVAMDLTLVKVDTSWCCEMDGFFAVNRNGSEGGDRGETLLVRQQKSWTFSSGVSFWTSRFAPLIAPAFLKDTIRLTVPGCDEEDVG